MTHLQVVPDEIPELKANMVVEVVQDFDVGVIEPGDRGRIVRGGPDAKMMLFTRFPSNVGPPLYDAVPCFKRGVVKLIDVDVPTSAEYENQRAEAIRRAMAELAFDTTGLPLRKADARRTLDGAVFRVIQAVPGILPAQLVLCFSRDEQRDHRARFSYTFSSIGRLIAAKKIRTVPTNADAPDLAFLRLHPV